MRIDIITIFPEVIASGINYGVVKRSRENGLLDVVVHDLRDFTHDQHRSVDDYCYGGGAGMLMKPQPLFEAVRSIGQMDANTKIVLLTPQGKLLNQEMLRQFSLADRMVLICGHYKGVDERVREHLVTDEVSIGDYVLSGGEIPALVLVDGISRLIPGALGNYESAQADSFSEGILDCPHYTRPAEFEGRRVPEVLLSGDPKRIKDWERKQALIRTYQRRPELLEDVPLADDEQELLNTLKEGDS